MIKKTPLSSYLLLFLLLNIFLGSIFHPFTPNNPIELEKNIPSSCTIFTASIGGKVYFGNNEDYQSNNVYQWFIPSQNISTPEGVKEIYGGVFFGFNNNYDKYVDTWPQGGMNEYGLCFDVNGLPNVPLSLNPYLPFPYSDYLLSQVQWECRNVEEVIDWYQNHRLYSLGGQIHYADKSGDAVVVSANENTGDYGFTRINSTFLVSTNFNLNDTENGNYPCSRYTTATQMLGKITYESDLNISACANVLYAVHLEGSSGTKYSNIFDPVNLDVYFNMGEEFAESEKYNLLEKLDGEESFDKEENFFGITGPQGYILVKTEQIDVQFKTYLTSRHGEILTVIVILCIPTCGFIIRWKKRNKRKKNTPLSQKKEINAEIV